MLGFVNSALIELEAQFEVDEFSILSALLPALRQSVLFRD
jgi:hypothetical protein